MKHTVLFDFRRGLILCKKSATAHRLSSDNTLFPDRIEIDTTNVTYYKGNILGYQPSITTRNNIASVSIGSSVFFVDVILEAIECKKNETEISPYSYYEFAKIVVKGWMNSPGHRKNILNPDFTYLGCGCVKYEKKGNGYAILYFKLTQNFGGSLVANSFLFEAEKEINGINKTFNKKTISDNKKIKIIKKIKAHVIPVFWIIISLTLCLGIGGKKN